MQTLLGLGILFVIVVIVFLILDFFKRKKD